MLDGVQLQAEKLKLKMVDELGGLEDAIEAAPSGRRNGARSASSAPENWRCPNIETSFDARTAGPPIGTGGAGGACRISSMLWIGVMPQIGSFENGKLYEIAPTRRPSMAA